MLFVLGLAPSIAHTGFDRLIFGKNASLSVDSYLHYLHHKYFVVNFSTDIAFLPWDKWMGTFHDGSDRAQEAMKKRLRNDRGGKKSK